MDVADLSVLEGGYGLESLSRSVAAHVNSADAIVNSRPLQKVEFEPQPHDTEMRVARPAGHAESRRRSIDVR
jgi:hypothetical protein